MINSSLPLAIAAVLPASWYFILMKIPLEHISWKIRAMNSQEWKRRGFNKVVQIPRGHLLDNYRRNRNIIPVRTPPAANPLADGTRAISTTIWKSHFGTAAGLRMLLLSRAVTQTETGLICKRFDTGTGGDQMPNTWQLPRIEPRAPSRKPPRPLLLFVNSTVTLDTSRRKLQSSTYDFRTLNNLRHKSTRIITDRVSQNPLSVLAPEPFISPTCAL